MFDIFCMYRQHVNNGVELQAVPGSSSAVDNNTVTDTGRTMMPVSQPNSHVLRSAASIIQTNAQIAQTTHSSTPRSSSHRLRQAEAWSVLVAASTPSAAR